jgi:RNA polymerase sigma factor (sigma-70 family)
MIEIAHNTDRELLEGLLRADREQVERLYQAYLPGIIRYVVRHGGTKADARDIFQDAVLVLYRKMKAGDLILTARLRTFLLAVCRNIWRTRQRDRREYRLQPGEGENRPDVDADTVKTITRVSRERVYREHFVQLGEQCREILKLFFAKVKMRDIAERLGLTEKYVKKRKFECKEKLVESIRKDGRFRELKF